MYTEYYRLTEDPFRISVDPRFTFAHSGYRSACACITGVLGRQEGILVVTGRPGTGKSTLLEECMERASGRGLHSAAIGGARLEDAELLRMVGYRFGIDAAGLEPAAVVRELERMLEQRGPSLLLVDEAQALSEKALDQLSLLTTLRAGTGAPLQLFLFGQEELRERLRSSRLESLYQRLIATCELEPLNLWESRDFILYRLQRAGWVGEPAISGEVFLLLHHAAQGLPRYLCKLGSRLLLHGMLAQRRRLEAADMATVIVEAHHEMLLPPGRDDETGVVPGRAAVRQLIENGTLDEQWSDFLNQEERDFVATPAPAADGPVASSDDGGSSDDRLREESTPATGDVTGERPRGAGEVHPATTAARSPARIAGYGVAAALLGGAVYLFTTTGDVRERTAGDGGEVVETVPHSARSEEARPAAGAAPAGTLPKPVRADVTAATDAGGKVGRAPAPVVPTPVPSSPAETGAAVPAGEDASAAAILPVREREIERLLALADEAIANNLLLYPREESAWRYFQEVLRLDPGNAAALAGVQRIARRYATLARIRMGKDDDRRALRYVERGLRVAPGDGELLQLKEELDRRRAEVVRNEPPEPAGETGPSLPPAGRKGGGGGVAAPPAGVIDTLKELVREGTQSAEDALLPANER